MTNEDNKWYSAKELAGFGLRGLPSSQRRIHDVADREKWLVRQVRSRGGRAGLRNEYQPPPDLQLQIDEIAARRVPVDSRSDAALRHAVSEAPNPDSAFEAMRRIRDASDLLQRFEAEIGYVLSKEWAAVLLELRAGEQLSQIGVRRIVEHLKWLESR